jgi:peptidoglycan/LPS O-acetylase OafA/YrhL
MSTHLQQPLKYIPAFDGIRGIFCLLIITHHWVMPHLKGPFVLLWWLLQVFFMLSAYLITRILVYDKNRMDFKAYAKRFYTRRALRIFPLYFGYIIVIGGLLILAGTSESGSKNKDYLYFVENWKYLFTYTYNFAEIINKFKGLEYVPSALFSHLWSLSLEEQFYMVFPMVIYFSSLETLKRIVVGLIIVGPIVRFIVFQWLYSQYPDSHWLGLVTVRNTIFQLDTLAYGTAIALFDIEKIKHPLRCFLGIFALWLLHAFGSAWWAVQNGLVLTVSYAIQEYTFITYFYNYVIHFTLTNIMCAAFVIAIMKKTVLVRLFESKVACYLGKLSYGIYVYHYFVMLLAAGILHVFVGNHTKFIGNLYVEIGYFLFYILLLIGVAHLSYKYFESYFLKIKEKG